MDAEPRGRLQVGNRMIAMLCSPGGDRLGSEVSVEKVGVHRAKISTGAMISVVPDETGGHRLITSDREGLTLRLFDLDHPRVLAAREADS